MKNVFRSKNSIGEIPLNSSQVSDNTNVIDMNMEGGYENCYCPDENLELLDDQSEGMSKWAQNAELLFEMPE
ncbi:hypothetical protein SNEBB_005580 [Seison nebaliae]|nr:hypothetical protein SNEBB_005580 [Seison nebaliae]